MLSSSVLLVFQLAGSTVALPLSDIQRIVPMARLLRPPGLPPLLEGILNLNGATVPVLRLARLLHLPVQPLDLHSALLIVGAPPNGALALLVDRVTEIITVSSSILLPVRKEESSNGCTKALVPASDRMILLLSLERLLIEKDREVLSSSPASSPHIMAQNDLHRSEAGVMSSPRIPSRP